MKIVCHHNCSLESGPTCGPGEVGEIWVKTDTMMDGYINETTEGLFDEDGFYR